MTGDLDDLLAELARATPDRRLDQLEPQVWARVDAASRAVSLIPLSWRLGAVAAALGIGLATGGVSAARPSTDLAVFSVSLELAPSTLLEGAPG